MLSKISAKNQNSTLHLIKNSTIFLRIAAVVSAGEGREPLGFQDYLKRYWFTLLQTQDR